MKPTYVVVKPRTILLGVVLARHTWTIVHAKSRRVVEGGFFSRGAAVEACAAWNAEAARALVPSTLPSEAVCLAIRNAAASARHGFIT